MTANLQVRRPSQPLASRPEPEIVLWRGKRLEDLSRVEVQQAFAEAWKLIGRQAVSTGRNSPR